jgi:hypothetical protein
MVHIQPGRPKKDAAMVHTFIGFTLTTALTFATLSSAQVMKFAPAAANSVILVDVGGLHDSAIGKTEDWAGKCAEDFAAGRAPFPPSARSILFARELDPNGLYSVRREVAVLQLIEPIGFQRLVEVVGGKVQTIGSRKVVASPRGFLAALPNDRSVVAYYPPDRQAFSRWLGAAEGRREPFSPYLARATETWPRTGQVMIALDMTEGLDESAIVEELKAQKELVRSETEAKLLARTFATIEGMRFTISVTDKIAAEWLIEFSEVIGVDAGLRLRPFLENAVKRIGDQTLDLSKWRMKVDEKGVSFRATLTTERLQSVFESIHSPILTGQSMHRKGGQDPNAAEANLRYFKNVGNVLRGIGRVTDRLSDYNAAAAEYERSAARIQRLSTENVDPELAAFAGQAAAMLTGTASSLRGVPRNAAEMEATAWNERFYYGPSWVNPGWTYPWRWGLAPPVYVNPNVTDMARSNIAGSVANESARRREGWDRIRELQRATAAHMTNKYGVDFGQTK